ncbi:YbaY family lipoprotein [Vibrio sp. TH_r3]|uniref:YbaY family lipoprotein n=1 Tax=Vibrio sp. TH_r3 TaxID=3082084 RepID=UPI0029552668|nr:YbaY family lipoprotein [Vibrio sp. TH_r3]MDV7103097.1 YbaY family lipoprotein [Vibrio sp. TH_r3]
MKKIIMLMVAVIMASTVLGCTTTDSVEKAIDQKGVMMSAIKGNIAYRERIALPPTAIITVTLEDVSKMDAAAKKIAEQTFTSDGEQVPFDFELSYDANMIELNHRYSVRATIHVDGKLRFTTDTVNSVITDDNRTQQLNLQLVSVK